MDSKTNLGKKTTVATVLIVALISCGLLSGCFKYSFSGGGPGHIKTIAIPLIENATAEYSVVEKITDALIQTFRSDNTLTVTEEEAADAVMWGTLRRVEDVPYTFGTEGGSGDFNVGEYKLTLYIDLEYYDRVKDETIWKEQVSAWGTYDHSSGSPEERNAGFDEAIEKLAQDILNRAFSTW